MPARLETVANVAVLVASVVLVGHVARHWSSATTPPATFTVPSAATLRQTGVVDTGGGAPTLILVADSRCHYCQESLPFYSQVTRAARQTGIGFVAVGNQPIEELQQFLASAGAAPDRVVRAMAQLGIRGTPTLLLADSQGRVTKYWLGRLEPTDEQEVLKIVSEYGPRPQE